MTERTRDDKGLAQDLQGAFYCLVGGFFAASIVLVLRGQEPAGGFMSQITVPVIELVSWLGPMAALLLSTGLASLGALLFLRASSLAAGRPLATLLTISLGFALVLGAFGRGGAVGAYLPGLLPGFVGQAVVLLLGLVLGWLGWTLLPAPSASPTSTAEALQRMSLAARHDAAAGVSSAEAALLVTEPRLTREAAAPRVFEAISFARPLSSPVAAGPTKPLAARTPLERPLARPIEEPAAVPAVRAPAERADDEVAHETDVPPIPAWEVNDELAEATALVTAEAEEGSEKGTEEEETEELEEQDDLEDEEGAVATVLEQEFDLEESDPEKSDAEESDADENHQEDLEVDLEQSSAHASAPAASDRVPSEPAWEQIGLFDEVEEVEEEVSAPSSAGAETSLTPAFDFGDESRRSHEPEPGAPAEPAPAFVLPATPPAPSAPRRATTASGTTASGTMPSRPAAPKTVPEKGAEGWDQLVFDAGCAVLDENRVAVSMLVRRFSLDFDQACRVLDELQASGLIGPYMGGRSRDILLSREEWLAHAPHAS